jgi:hypothetical protein
MQPLEPWEGVLLDMHNVCICALFSVFVEIVSSHHLFFVGNSLAFLSLAFCKEQSRVVVTDKYK